MAKFEQSSRRRSSDVDLVVAELTYFGTLQEIIRVDYRGFFVDLFDVQWFKIVTQGRNASVRRGESGFMEVDSSKKWSDLRDTFVLPEHCEQVCY